MKQIKENLWKLSDGEYLKKLKGGYNIIYPIKKDLEKPFAKDNIHWRNLLISGSWNRFFTYMAIVLLILFMAWGYNHDIKSCIDIIEKQNRTSCYQTYDNDFPEFNFSLEDLENGGDKIEDIFIPS